MEIKTIKSRVNKSVEKKEIKALAEDEEEEPKVKRKRINKKINSNHINYLINCKVKLLKLNHFLNFKSACLNNYFP